MEKQQHRDFEFVIQILDETTASEKNCRYQTVARVVNGTFSMQKEWAKSRGMPWDEQEVRLRADRVF